CSAACTVELGYVCTGEPSVCEITCGDGDVDPGEECDDGRNDDGDGCSAGCAIELGYTCSGTPSSCVTTCGDGLKANVEECDDDAPAEDGDGCSAACTVELGWSCTGATPSTCTTTCGDGIPAGAEQCDDGCGPTTPGACDAADDNDGCSATCTLECGNGAFNPLVEECDDGNRTAGDGCSPTCTFEVAACGPGEDLVQIRSADVPKAIPDNTAAGVDSLLTVPAGSQGAVRRVVVGIGRLDHTWDGDVTLSLVAPAGRSRDLVVRRGGSSDNFVRTRFDDSAATAISAGSAPFTGSFRPEQSISSLTGFGAQAAAGTWRLHATDVSSGDTGTIRGWTLSLCVDPTGYCGNGAPDPGEDCDDGNTVDDDACSNTCQLADGCGDGNIDAGEVCDDDNRVAGDGCSATCQLELACGAGEVPVMVTNESAAAITDDGVVNTFPVTVPTAGGVRRALVMISGITHANTAHLDIGLGSPSGIIRNLSDDNGSGASYAQTLFDDTAAGAVTSGSSPFTGRFRPEASLSAARTVDLVNTRADGIWDLRVADDTAGTGGTFQSWTLALCVAPGGYCGNGTVEPDEECDDGNAVNNDACSNLCAIADGCGDGNLDAGEACDDNNATSGDGCSASCTLDIDCAPGQTPVVLEATSGAAIVDNVHGGTISAITVPTAGVVRKVIAGVSITHGYTGDVDIFLTSPFGVQRDLSSDNGSSGDNYVRTLFSDTAPTAITSGSPPYSGTFRPEQTISDAAGFRDQSAAGEWVLRALDDSGGVAGVLDGWSLALCIDTSVTHVCGNGYTEPDESCDDGNVIDGDGCSAACQIELACATGQTPVIVRSNNPAQIIGDNLAAGATSPLSVATAGTVRKAIAVVGAISHTYDGDVDISLISPAATTLDLSSDQSGVNYASTMFDDGAATAITSGTAPYRGRFRPEAALSGVANQAAAGAWTLRAVDDAGGDGGLLGPWVLGLCVE
ncbi:MAG: proprotein convertase P-domain-containing protein, partial [Deltaproteobacteria bacterium]|nr:proprotein convertase P-domain-containing protein [Kofleriaceae bacterium]